MNRVAGQRERTIAAKAFLLAVDPDRERVRDRPRTARLVRAAALTDLLLRSRLVDDGGRARAERGESTGDSVLDGVLTDVATDRPRSWKWLVRKGSRDVLDALEIQLEAQRAIRVDRSLSFGLFPRRRVTLVDASDVARLHGIVGEVLRGGADVGGLPVEDAALTALAAAVELPGVVSGKDRRRHRKRVEAIEERGGVAIPALRAVFKELRGARAAAASSGATGSQ